MIVVPSSTKIVIFSLTSSLNSSLRSNFKTQKEQKKLLCLLLQGDVKSSALSANFASRHLRTFPSRKSPETSLVNWSRTLPQNLFRSIWNGTMLQYWEITLTFKEFLKTIEWMYIWRRQIVLPATVLKEIYRYIKFSFLHWRGISLNDDQFLPLS